MVAKGLKRLYEDCDKLRTSIAKLESSPIGSNDWQLWTCKTRLERFEAMIRCTENQQPLIATWPEVAPEIFKAMDLDWYSICYYGVWSPYKRLVSDLEECDKMAGISDICSLQRLGLYMVEAGLVPLPTAMVGLVSPCEAMGPVHEAIMNNKEWRDIPTHPTTMMIEVLITMPAN